MKVIPETCRASLNSVSMFLLFYLISAIGVLHVIFYIVDVSFVGSVEFFYITMGSAVILNSKCY